MSTSEKQRVIWVKRAEAEAVADTVIRERANIADPTIEVVIESIAGWNLATIPAGSRDKWGDLIPGVITVGYSQLPPEGKIFVTAAA